MIRPFPAGIKTRPFGPLTTGHETTLYSLTNRNGTCAQICDYGATLVSFHCKDKQGQLGDIVLGFDSVQGYQHSNIYMGAMIGRFANRIGGGKFSLDGNDFTLATNLDEHHIHGGEQGFDKRLWHVNTLSQSPASLRFTLFSPDGDQGYPGNLTIHVIYKLDDDDQLSITCEATCDQATLISITNHSYFNLAGKGKVLDHLLHVNADKFTPLGEDRLPTGDIDDVKNTPFDFRTPTKIGERIFDDNDQLRIGHGYDHCYVNKRNKNKAAPLVASLLDENSGRRLDVYSDAPAVQLCVAWFFDGTGGGKSIIHEEHGALCIEPQNFPDAPNREEFPSAALRPGEKFKQTIIFSPGTN